MSKVKQNIIKGREVLDNVYIEFYHTKVRGFGLRCISLIGGEILILKELPISNKIAKYVSSYEEAMQQMLTQIGAISTHKLMYLIKDTNDFVEAVYRRRYE